MLREKEAAAASSARARVDDPDALQA